MSFKIFNVVNRGSVRWIVLAVFLFGTIFGATGIAAAELDGTDSIYAQTTMDGNSIDSGSELDERLLDANSPIRARCGGRRRDDLRDWRIRRIERRAIRSGER